MGNVFDERDWPTGFSPFTEDGLWEENRLTGDERRVSERRRETGWVGRIFERTSTKERSTELRPIIGVLKSLHCRVTPDLGLTLSAPTALTNSVEPLCLATA